MSVRTAGKRDIARRRQAALPESRVFNELRAFERRIDAVLLRKEVVMHDINKPSTGLRTLRVSVYNTYACQGPTYCTTGEAEEKPTWTLRVEGQLLGGGGGAGKYFEGRRFTSFFRKVVIHFDDELGVENNIVEWDRESGGEERDGFEVQRAGSRGGRARLALHLHHSPARYRLSDELATLLGLQTDTRSRIIVKFWYYVKNHRLRDPEDRARILLDAPLQRLFRCSSMAFAEAPARLREHLAPAPPIELEYEIKLQGNPQSFVQTWDVQVPDTAAPASALGGREAAALEARVEAALAELARRRRKRAFLLAFAQDPAGFLENLVAAVAHDYKVAHGHEAGDAARLAAFYEQAHVPEAVSLYLTGLQQAAGDAQ
mmetsp:Transcript_17106/g.66621  ORF Transcript_17106/g.66621 Transcript_17106/m.66621 type:complete len:374 (+) Transcript_17106:15-1136(+)